MTLFWYNGPVTVHTLSRELERAHVYSTPIYAIMNMPIYSGIDVIMKLCHIIEPTAGRHLTVIITEGLV